LGVQIWHEGDLDIKVCLHEMEIHTKFERNFKRACQIINNFSAFECFMPFNPVLVVINSSLNLTTIFSKFSSKLTNSLLCA